MTTTPQTVVEGFLVVVGLVQPDACQSPFQWPRGNAYLSWDMVMRFCARNGFTGPPRSTEHKTQMRTFCFNIYQPFCGKRTALYLRSVCLTYAALHCLKCHPPTCILLKLRLTYDSNPIAPTKSISFNKLRSVCPTRRSYSLNSIFNSLRSRGSVR